MIYIPDPIEILDGQIEEQINLIDSDGNYPCAQCGVLLPVGDMFPASGHPASSLLCGPCAIKALMRDEQEKKER